MPLVIPGINNTSGGSSQDDWSHKLMGKTVTEGSSDVNSFAKKDLPETHRIVKPGDMTTMDHNPDRLNIHVDESGTVHNVNYG
ncbi:hypothetical protein BO82DRAFT_71154 [Aspergillus uvarum CBS 121591]|uniref:Uncharacterized protein n=4 Tax=Aspergillus TaxID=5052 RepID=A0A319D232_9EURO|nr:hypothetical protein BO82DRAFT_71154 [Aspergillus uvarum CBS 121591]XP_025527372.1 hypothetical protein BO86DRAFT_389471 [Aspergillus japonicus CBS 114.51]PYI13297.1 hypothetical protein BO99DRAFT_397107 [Aspergillus violaceofuscus CBS 115571]PYI35178.1 hypothetical protein BP00DRAFT_443003 [Aspergillus indologenus CBS 114.80]PYH81958.1 hypothetical protein BO82DRAFT_71154 [Aspergillus uvarum CBS 121591]RAH81478.1 hypothetical protein BO86DRAFT_389471 [Aspergillus japonicus CBS 114.51]